MDNNGVTTVNLETTPLADGVLVNRGSSTMVQPIDQLSQQLAASGPLASALVASSKGWLVQKTLAQLNGIAGTFIGQYGQVTDDGANNGIYAWGGAAWVKIGTVFDKDSAFDIFGVGISGVFKALRARPTFANGAVANVGDENRLLGLKIPAGQSGQGTALRYQWFVDGTTAIALSNGQLQASLAFFQSAAFDRALDITVNIVKKDGSVQVVAPTILTSVVNGQFRLVKIQFTCDVNTACIEFCATQSVATTVASEQFVSLIGILLAVSSTVSSPATLNSQMAEAAARTQSLSAIQDVGPVFDDAFTVGQMFGGAQYLLDNDGRAIGWAIPAGQTGFNSYISVRIDVAGKDARALQGSTVEWSFVCDHTPGYSRALNFALANQNATLATFQGGRVPVSDTQTIIYGTGVIPAGSTSLAASVQQAANNAAVTAETFVVSDVKLIPIASQDPTRSPAQLAAYWSNSRLKALALSAVDHASRGEDIRPAALTVDVPVGASINAAITTDNPPAKGRRRKLRLGIGTYKENRIFPKMYDALIGAGPGLTIIDGSQPANASLADIANNSAIESYYDGDYYGLYVTGRNMRYPGHSDLASEKKDIVQRWRNSILEHQGNDDAIQYQISLGAAGNPGGVWASTYGFGPGFWSGWDISVENCVIIGGIGAAGGHNNLNFSKPAKASYKNVILVARDAGGRSLSLGSLGAKIQSTVLVENCSHTGDIYSVSLPWLQTTLDYQPADHHEWLFSGSGNTPAVFRIEDHGRALKIESAATAGASTVAVSGSAVAILFGSVVSKPGAGGIKGYAYGAFDISGRAIGPNYDIVITSLGKRLGNCTVSNKILTLSVDGGAAVNVVFNADYTNATNATILGMINAALGATATASEYAIGERYRPNFTDEERRLKNVSAEGILMGMACAYTGNDGKSIRKMTSADPVTIFAGVAWEDIYPNTFGRVKMAGYLYIGDILRSDAAAVTMNTAFSIDPATAGYFKTGGPLTVITAFRSDAVRVLTADKMVALGGSAVEGPPGIGVPTSGGGPGYYAGWSGGNMIWLPPAQVRADIGAAAANNAALTGVPTAPTAVSTSNDNTIATTAFTHAAVAAIVGAAPELLNAIDELAAAINDDPNFAVTVMAAIALRQPLDATLTALAAIVTAADQLIYATGVDTFATTAFTSVARTLLAAATQAAQRMALGLGSAATQNTGASGGAIPVLNVANTWTAKQTMAGAPVVQSVANAEPDANRGFRQSIDGGEYLAIWHDNSKVNVALQGTNKLQITGTIFSALIPLQLPSFTVATLPSAASYPRCKIYVSDGTSNKREAISDGTNWRWPDGATVS